jgi:hypothetical protein
VRECSDEELSMALRRSIRAIQIRRCRLLKEVTDEEIFRLREED